MAARVTSLLLVLVLVTSCQKSGAEGFVEGKQRFRELLTLRDQIAKEFQETVGDINVSAGKRMTIKFVNSPLASRGREEKQQRADMVARFVAANYKPPLTSVSIQFVSGTAGSGSSVSLGEIYVGRVAGVAP